MPWVSIHTDQIPNMSDADRENNVTIIWNNLGSKGYTANAVAAIASNMQYEGFLNPGQYELDKNYDIYQYGAGLCGWTPVIYQGSVVSEQHKHLGNWCQMNNLNWELGDSQLSYLNYEMTDWYNSERLTDNWYAPNLGYPEQSPLTAEEFIVSELEPETLAAYWALYYEHPNETALQNSLSDRMNGATTWYNFIITLGPPVPPEPPTPIRKKKMPIWMMCRRNYF